MDMSHLYNCIQMLERMAKRARLEMELCVPQFNGEMAQFYAEHDHDALLEMTDDEFMEEVYPIYFDLCGEMARRIAKAEGGA